MAAFAYDLKNILDARRNYMSIKWHHSGTMDNAVSEREKKHRAVSYTHLTLPTIRLV